MINIEELNDSHIGSFVKYIKDYGEDEVGRIKSFDKQAGLIYVVFKCGERWNEFHRYTAASCEPKDLEFIKENIETSLEKLKDVVYEN